MTDLLYRIFFVWNNLSWFLGPGWTLTDSRKLNLGEVLLTKVSKLKSAKGTKGGWVARGRRKEKHVRRACSGREAERRPTWLD